MIHLPVHELVSRLPKIDLHCHLDGGILPATLLSLAEQQQLALPTDDPQRLLAYMQVDPSCTSLQQYLSKFDFVLPFLQTAGALQRVAAEAVQQAAEQNCLYIEVRFAPQLHRTQGLSVEEVITAVCVGLKQGEEQYGTVARAIAICMRHHPDSLNNEVIEAATQFKHHGIVAVDLAGDESSYPPERFRKLFAIAHKKHLPVTIHAGEAGGASNVEEAVTHLGAARIGHGVRLLEDARILDLIRQKQTPLELCPVSNLQTKAVADPLAYPLRTFINADLFVTINTDNPTVSGTNLLKEHLLIVDHYSVTIEELARMTLNGLLAAFAEEPTKKQLLTILQQRMAEQGIAIGQEGYYC